MFSIVSVHTSVLVIFSKVHEWWHWQFWQFCIAFRLLLFFFFFFWGCQDGGSVCCCCDYHLYAQLQNCLVRCVLHVMSDACHAEWEYPQDGGRRKKGWRPLLWPFYNSSMHGDSLNPIIFHHNNHIFIEIHNDCNQWRNRQGAECSPETSDQEIFADVSGEKKVRKKVKGVKIEKKRWKIWNGSKKML